MTARHVLANVAPAVLARLLGEPPPDAGARGRAAEGQHAALAAAAAAGPVGRPARGVRRDLPRQRVRYASSSAPTRRPRRGARPRARARARSTATRSPTRRSSAPSCGTPGAQTLTLLRAAHAGAAVRAPTTTAGRRRRSRRRCASLDSVLAEPIEDCLCATPTASRAWRPAPRSTSRHELALPGGNIFHRDLRGRSPRTRPRPGTWGVETEHPPSCSAARARGAAAASAASPGTTPR